MNSGKEVRTRRLFRADERSVIAALDHGIAGLSPLGSLAKPEDLIVKLVAAGVDAFIVTPGIGRQCAPWFGGKGLVIRVDCGPTALTGEWAETHPAVKVEEAARLGADAVIAMGVVGAEGEARSLQALARLAAECEACGIVLIAEMLPGGFAASACSDEQISVAARVGAEIGADIIKIRYSGSEKSFRAIIANCYRPIVVLGGSKQTPPQLAASTREAMTAGARGVAVGRNIWQAEDPSQVASLLVEAVHG